MIQQKEIATPDERKGVSKICIWKGTDEIASFFAYNQTLFHSSGQTCESAPLTKTRLTITQENLNTNPIKVLTLPIMQNKILAVTSKVHTYPHREALLFDLHLSIACYPQMNLT